MIEHLDEDNDETTFAALKTRFTHVGEADAESISAELSAYHNGNVDDLQAASW